MKKLIGKAIQLAMEYNPWINVRKLSEHVTHLQHLLKLTEGDADRAKTLDIEKAALQLQLEDMKIEMGKCRTECEEAKKQVRYLRTMMIRNYQIGPNTPTGVVQPKLTAIV